MKKIIFLSIFLLLLTGKLLFSQEYTPKELKKIHSFLTELETAAVEKDTTKLKQMVHPVKYGKENSQTIIINNIILNDENSSGDFSFSLKAFSQITDSLFTKFKPIPDELLFKLIDRPPFNTEITGLENVEIPVFDYKGVHILLTMKEGKEIRLLFWESLNILLGKQSHAVIEIIEDE